MYELVPWNQTAYTQASHASSVSPSQKTNNQTYFRRKAAMDLQYVCLITRLMFDKKNTLYIKMIKVLPKWNAIKQRQREDNCQGFDIVLHIKIRTQVPLSVALKLLPIRTFITISVGLGSVLIWSSEAVRTHSREKKILLTHGRLIESRHYKCKREHCQNNPAEQNIWVNLLNSSKMTVKILCLSLAEQKCYFFLIL